jgi:magnesium-transporting ATPase (P-type)
VILAEGDHVPADATVLSAHDLQCDESLLMGEAAPVSKIAPPGAPVRQGADDILTLIPSASSCAATGKLRSRQRDRAARSAPRLCGWIASHRGCGSR